MALTPLDLARTAVAVERDLRGWSFYNAAVAARGIVSHETWRRFETGDIASLTKKMRLAVETAFEWPHDWPTNPPPPPEQPKLSPRAIDSKPDQILGHLGESPSRAELAARLTQLAEEIRKLGESVSSIDTTVTTVLSTVGRVEKTCGNVDAMMKRVDAILPPPPARPVVAPPGKVTTRR